MDNMKKIFEIWRSYENKLLIEQADPPLPDLDTLDIEREGDDVDIDDVEEIEVEDMPPPPPEDVGMGDDWPPETP